MIPSVETLRERGAVGPLDASFAHALGRVGDEQRPEVLAAAALLSRKVALGDVCLDLRRWLAEVDAPEADLGGFEWPLVEDWAARLRESPLVSGEAAGDAPTPLVLDAQGRLYLQRLYADEQRVAAALVRRAAALPDAADPALAESIDRLLPAAGPGAAEIRAAAGVAARCGLCVLSGGPGTGKTTTAARLLAVLAEAAWRADGSLPRIALAAPTGKAAARLSQAITTARAGLDCSEVVRAAVPAEARTLHRLLGLGRRPSAAAPRTLAADVVLVDEASMVDLALMAKLLAALPSEARLVLLGDPDQLASVEAGAVFADLCGDEPVSSAPAPSEVGSCVVRLTHSHRYGIESGIGALAAAIRRGDAEAALAVLADPELPDVRRVDPAPGDPLASLRDRVVAGHAAFASAATPAGRLEALGRFQLLCALREGPFGVRDLDRGIDRMLVREGMLLPVPGAPVRPGRPVLVTRNAPQVGLWNGDVGVVDEEPTPGVGLRVWFEDGGGAPRSLAASRLPPHEPVLAMTVHKSQGSEFDEVALVLPDEPLPLLTRELVYTAVTRARARVVVQASEAVLSEAIRRRVSRATGLRAALWPGSDDRATV